uniref:Protein MCM10 homolog n=1 Tax=Bracon brevicornis TaxID=1563983 RepID=A0A6V7HYA3_9HYME
MSDNNDSDSDEILKNLLANDDDDNDDVSTTTKVQTIKELDYNFLDKPDELEKIEESKDASSLIHRKHLDSSDEEDEKYFKEEKYSTSGRNVKELLKHQSERSESNRQESSKGSEKIIKKQGETTALTNWLNKPADVYSDPIFGLRIVKPLISSTELRERMQGRRAVTVSKIKYFLSCQDQSEDWVIAGVLIHRSATKKSQNGSQYCIWQISDLSDKIPTISIFLFSSAYKSFWKTTEGNVIAILNPGVMESRSDKAEATLSVDNPQKIMIIGNSKDLGRCKSVKKSGEPCTNIVNTNSCQYCVYHVKQEYSKASRRTDLQTDSNNRRFANAFGKQTGIAGNAGQTQNGINQLNMLAIPAKRNPKMEQKDAERLALLKGGSAALEKSTQQINSPINSTEKIDTNTKRGWMATRSGLSLTAISNLSSKVEVNDKTIQRNPSQSQNSLSSPRLGANKTGDFIDFSQPITKKQISAAKMNAIKLMKERGGIKQLANVNKIRESKEKIEAVKRKRELSDQQKEESSKLNEAKRLCSTTSDRFKQLMEATSAHADLIDRAEEEEKEKYFNKLEAKEKMEEKMMNTFKVECKAVKCLICKYTSFSASDICKEKRHPLRVIDAVKSFFKCADCGNRTVSLDKLPSLSCQKCSGSRWLRAGMMDEKKTSINANPLSIRGGEQKFVGSQITDANINLLIPDDN